MNKYLYILLLSFFVSVFVLASSAHAVSLPEWSPLTGIFYIKNSYYIPSQPERQYLEETFGEKSVELGSLYSISLGISGTLNGNLSINTLHINQPVIVDNHLFGSVNSGLSHDFTSFNVPKRIDFEKTSYTPPEIYKHFQTGFENAQEAPVPEPSSMILGLLGSGSIFVRKNNINAVIVVFNFFSRGIFSA